jgi:hypothetical protein
VLPQVQVTVISWYFGWMSAFMILPTLCPALRSH